MKKFFSLVLALVMALSLTTVAWGAAANVSDLNGLKTATGEINVTQQIVVNEVVSLSNVTINTGNVVDAFKVVANGKLTLGAGVTITGDNSVLWVNGGSVVIDGAVLNVSASSPNNAVYVDSGSFELKSGSVNQSGAKTTLSVAGGTATVSGGTVTSSACTAVVAKGTGVVTISGGEVKTTVTDPEFCAAYAKDGGKLTVTAGKVDAAAGYGLVAAAGGEVTVAGGTVDGVKAHEANTAKATITGGTVTGDVDAANGATMSVEAGTFTDDVIPYLATGSVYKDGVVTKQGTVPSTGTTSTGTVTSGTVTPSKPTLYKLAAVGGSMTKVKDTFTSIKLTTVSGKIDADVVKYVPNIYNLDGNLYIQVAKAAADYALYNNGAWIYLFDAPQATDADVITAYATSVVMDKLVVPADDEIDCGDCLKNGVLASYYVSGDSVYYAGGLTWAYFNGEFVKYDKDTKVAFQGHVWDADSIIYKATDVKGSKVPVTIECENCEKTFKVVYKTAFDNTWVKGVNYETAPGVLPADYYIVLESATSAPVVTPSTDKVQSADTFDAGIAMYVGMSVMAAAGSVVVLKKRED